MTAHLPDPGRLKELLIPGCRMWLKPAEGPHRKTEWTALLIENPNSEGLISLDTVLPNRLIATALAEEAIEEMKDWSIERTEVPVGGSRFDFLLANAFGQKMYLEVKSVSMVHKGIGMFFRASPTDQVENLS